MTETRKCEQCGTSFSPRREHARFCSARCRVAWNRQHVGESPDGASALDWTIAGMRDTIDRLLRARGGDLPHAFAAISEAVWWVTLVDATLVRYHPDRYDTALAAHPEPDRLVIEGTFGGLRFVRNWMGYHVDHADFIQPQRGDADADPAPLGPLPAWTWRSLPEPILAGLPAAARNGSGPGTWITRPRWLASRSATPSGGRPPSCTGPPRTASASPDGSRGWGGYSTRTKLTLGPARQANTQPHTSTASARVPPAAAPTTRPGIRGEIPRFMPPA